MKKSYTEIWDKIPHKYRPFVLLLLLPFFAVGYFKAWHVKSVQAQIGPFKEKTEMHVTMILRRQDDLQRSFNYLEERIDKGNHLVLEALLKAKNNKGELTP